MATQYITAADLQAFYGADDYALIEQLGANVQSVVEAVCAQADALLGISQGSAATPSAVLAVKKAVADIARLHLHSQSASDQIKENAKEAMAFLREMAAANRSLFRPQDDPATPEDEASTGAACGAGARRLGDSLYGW